jgi:MFS family permease
LLFNLRAAVSPKYAYFYLGVFFLLLWGGIVSLKQQYECLDNAPCPEGLHLHQQVVSLVKDFAARHKPGRSWTMAGSFAILASLLLPAMSCESKKVPLYGLLGFSREFDVNWQVVFCWLPFLAAVLLLFTGVKRQGRWRKVVYIISCLMFCAGAGYLAIFAVNGIVGFSQAKVPYQEIVGKVASEHGSGSTFGSSTEISNATFWSLWTFGVIVPLLLLLLRGWYPVRKLNMFLPERFKGFILGLFRLATSAAVVSAAAACMLQLGIMLWGMGVFLCAGGILLLGLVAQLNETRVQPGISREKTTV